MAKHRDLVAQEASAREVAAGDIGMPEAPVADQSADAAKAKDNIPVALLFALLGSFMGTGIDVTFRMGAEQYALLGLMFWRYWGGGFLLLPVWLNGIRTGKRKPPKREAYVFYTWRGGLHAIMAWTFFFALTQLPLAEVTVLAFCSVLMVPLTERVILAEPLRPAALAASVVGFLGVLVVALGGDDSVAREGTNPALGRICAMVAALFYALSLVLIRHRSKTDDTLTISIGSNFGTGVALIIPMLWFAPAVPMDAIPWIIALSILGTITWIFLSMGYARAPAHVLAPVDYGSALWAALFGYLIFAEVPAPSLYWGGALIIIGGLMLLKVKS